MSKRSRARTSGQTEQTLLPMFLNEVALGPPPNEAQHRELVAAPARLLREAAVSSPLVERENDRP